MGDDSLNAAASNDGKSNVFLSGDIGNDTITAGSGSDYVFGGQGNDSINGGANHASGTTTMLFGGQDEDTITFASVGGVAIYGGQGDDNITLSGGAADDTTNLHFVFGNLGNDTIVNSDAGASIYGGQGDDVITSSGVHAVLHGDLGNDSIVASALSDTIYGGGGADTLTSGGHATFMIGAGDSTAQQVTTTVTSTSGTSTSTTSGSEANLDHITNFTSGSDVIVLAGHNNLTIASASSTGNLTTATDTAHPTDEASAFQAAYLYAYGDGTAAHVAHDATAYLAVQETAGGSTYTYLFAQDHAAIEFNGAITFHSNDVIAG